MTPQLASAQLTVILVGAVAGARRKFGGLAARLAYLAKVIKVAMDTNQETAAKLARGQNQEWQQLAGYCYDINRI